MKLTRGGHLCKHGKGFCQVEKNPKTRIGQTPLTHSPIHIFNFFGNMFNKKTPQKTEKNMKFPPKKNNPSWGLTHPPTSEFFSDFFNLTKPLKSLAHV